MEMKKHEQMIAEERNQRLRMESVVSGERQLLLLIMLLKLLLLLLLLLLVFLLLLLLQLLLLNLLLLIISLLPFLGVANKLGEVEERLRRTEDSSKENKNALGYHSSLTYLPSSPASTLPTTPTSSSQLISHTQNVERAVIAGQQVGRCHFSGLTFYW